MEKNLGTVLKELRKKKKLTAKETSDKLLSMGYEISDKTLSGYETGIRMPNADVFMALCKIYDCKNILEMFSFINADYSIPTDDEWNMIEKYRLISKFSSDGASVVDTILDREYSIAEKLKKQSEKIQKISMEVPEKIVPKRILAYYGKIAAAGKSYGFDDMIAGTIECHLTENSQRADYAIGVSGDSMEPTFYDGDIVYVKKNANLNIGDIGIFQKDNGIYIKEVGENGLISHNKTYKPMVNGGTVICLGKVLGKVESD